MSLHDQIASLWEGSHKMKKILIVEDEPGIRMAVEDRLVSEGYQVICEADGLQGEQTALAGDFDLLILDLMLPNRDGLTICQNLRKQGINLPILILTARGGSGDTVVGLRSGADDYLAKPFDMAVLVARVEALLRRTVLPQANKLKFGDFVMDLATGELRKGEQSVEVNTLEFRLLEYLVRNQGKILNRDDILDNVWGYDKETSTRTIDVHIAKLRQRLGESDNPRHILTVRGRGYKFQA